MQILLTRERRDGVHARSNSSLKVIVYSGCLDSPSDSIHPYLYGMSHCLRRVAGGLSDWIRITSQNDYTTPLYCNRLPRPSPSIKTSLSTLSGKVAATLAAVMAPMLSNCVDILNILFYFDKLATCDQLLVACPISEHPCTLQHAPCNDSLTISHHAARAMNAHVLRDRWQHSRIHVRQV